MSVFTSFRFCRETFKFRPSHSRSLFSLLQDGDSFEEAPRTWRPHYELSAEQRRLLAQVKLPYDGSNATTVMNCTEPGVSCVLLQCPTVAFPRQQTSMIVTLSMRVKLHDLGEN